MQDERALNYSEMDAILDNIERILYPLSKEYRLQHVNIERWRWDYPTISLSWLGDDYVNRNINILLSQPSAHEEFPLQAGYMLTVEANAWQDVSDELNEGLKRTRHWRHAIIEKLSGGDDNEYRIAGALNQAYKVVAAWSKQDLDRKSQDRSIRNNRQASGDNPDNRE